MPTNFLTPSALSARTWFEPEVKIGTPYFFSHCRDQLLLLAIAEQHEGRRAGGMDHVDLVGGEFGDLLLIGGQHAAELADGAVADVVEQRDDADPVRQHADQLLQRAGALGRLHGSDHAAPCAIGHCLSPSTRTGSDE